MIYWRIKHPGKSWRNWADGTASDVEEAKRDAVESVTDDETAELFPWAERITCEMWECRDIEDFSINAAVASKVLSGE